MSNTDFDPDAFLKSPAPSAPPAAAADGTTSPTDASSGFDPDAFLSSAPPPPTDISTPPPPPSDTTTAPTQTMHQREAAARQGMASESPDTPAGWGEKDVTQTPIDHANNAELIRMWKDVSKGLPQGMVAAITGGIAGDTEGAIRQLLKPYGVDQQTVLPTSVEGGPVLGDRGLPSTGGMASAIPFVGPAVAATDLAHGALQGTIGPPTSSENAMGRQIGSMMIPFMPKWFRDFHGADEARLPPEPPAPLPEAPKLTTPRTDPQGRTVSPDLLPPDTPHELPENAPAGAASVSPLQDISPEAIQHVHQTLTEAGFTPHTLDQRLEEMSPHEFGFEVAGSDAAPFRSANGVVVQGGQGGQDVATAVRQRTLEMPQRINNALDSSLGSKEDLSTISRAERADQLKASQPLYQQFTNLKIPPTQAIKDLMPRLQAAGVFARARYMASLEGKPWNQSFFTPGQTKVFPTAESWNYVNQALNSKIENSLSPIGRPTSLTRILTGMKGELLNAIDNHPNPQVAGVWKQARDAYAGPEQIRVARQMGQKLLSESVDPDEVPHMTAGFSEPQMAALRQGLRKSIADTMGRPGNQDPQVIKKLLGPNNQAKVRSVIGDDKADSLFDALNHENDMYQSKNTLSTSRVGSSTARNQIDAKQFQAQPSNLANHIGNASELVRHPVRAIAGHALDRANTVMQKAAQDRLDRIRDDVGKIWTMQGPERNNTLPWILEHGGNYARRNSLYARGGRVRARGGGVLSLADGGDADATDAPPAPDTSVDPDVDAWQRTVDPATGVPHLVIHPQAPNAPPPEATPPQPSPSEDDKAPETPETDDNAPEGGPTPEKRGVMDQLLGLTGPRYQLWPEKIVRSGLSLGHDVMTDPVLANTLHREDLTDIPVDQNTPREGGVLGLRDYFAPVQAEPQDPLIERSQDMAGLAGGAGMGAAEEGALGATGGKLKTPEQITPLHSGVVEAVQKAPLTKATPEQWQGYLKNQPGVKQEELDQIGMPAGGGSITKDQMLQHAADNQVRLNEVMKGGQPDYDRLSPAEQKEVQVAARDYMDHPPTLDDLRAWYRDFGAGSDTVAPRFSDPNYQLPGGENYRELLMKMPTEPEPNSPLDRLNWRAPQFQTNHWPDDPNTLMHLRMNDRDIPDVGKSLHLEEVQSDWHQKGRKEGYTGQDDQMPTGDELRTPAIISPVRTVLRNANLDPDKFDYQVKYVEPLGTGFAGSGIDGHMYDLIVKPKVPIDPQKVSDALSWFTHSDISAMVGGRKFDIGDGDDLGAVEADKDGTHHIWLRSFTEDNPKVPDAPFKTSWPELGLKRAIVQAAKEGKDAISWTPGQQQADRYDLSKHVDTIAYDPKTQQLAGWKSNKPVLPMQTVPPEKLADYIGKEVAGKLLNKPLSPHGNHMIEGQDLKVGGEGMKGFYDKMLPNIANKLGKKYGAQVEYKDLPTGIDDGPISGEEAMKRLAANSNWNIPKNEGDQGAWFANLTFAKREKLFNDARASKDIKVPVLRLTPKLKEQALKGLPLFSDTSKPGAAMSGTKNDQEEVQQRAAGGRVIAKEINHKPSGAQKAAGNYKKEHVRIHGMDITVENAKGAARSGIGKDGKPWKCTMVAHYGYFKRSEGADGDHVDVYLGPHTTSPKVFVVDQIQDHTKVFDEHKVMLGFANKQQAINIYHKCFSDGKGKDRMGAIHEMPVDQFKDWLQKGDTTKPLSGTIRIQGGKITRKAFEYTAKASAKDQCQHCHYTSGNMSKSQGCGLFRMVSQRCPDDFDLDPHIDAEGWCSGWRPRDE